ncbi:MAG TPA: protein kinase [Kofleriaceae bacterium]|nr:protein kinase [Kofleriaceae bacterium]
MAGRATDPPERPSGEITAMLPRDQVPAVAPLARVLAPTPGTRPGPAPEAAHDSENQNLSIPALRRSASPDEERRSRLSGTGLILDPSGRQAAVPPAGTAADALRAEEIERTRLFIRMGWPLSAVAAASVLVIDAPPVLAALFIAGMVLGMVVSAGYHRAFADPRNYTERALMTLAVICVINGQLAVVMYGAFTASPLMIVIGIHFVARTEAERVARWIFATAVISYAAIAIAITSGAVADPGVFASDRPVSRATLATGACFVLAACWLAYYTARQFRHASLAAIEDLQRATRVASQREALMAELRVDLERALLAGPGRHTDQVIGRFQLGPVIGRGAMGEVYAATDLAAAPAAPAAIKLLRRELAADPEQRARFARELRAGRAIASPHVARVLDGSADAALPFLAMERLHGHTLAELLRREPRLDAPALLALCRQVAAGLDAAAAAGVVHRDVKPHNLWFGDDGAWKVLDFGVALIAGDPAADERGVIGTPHYMAPEQAQRRRADPRSDLHALGAVVYRCATGRQPFDAADPAALLYAVVHRMPVRPGALAELPADVDRWCAIALAKPPADRFATGAAMADALAAALAGELDDALRARGDDAIRARPWETA